MANGTYEVCNVVTDNAGHSATARLTLTIANLAPLGPAAPLGSTGTARGRGVRPGRAKGAHEAQGRASAHEASHRNRAGETALGEPGRRRPRPRRRRAQQGAIAARAGRRARDLPGARRVGSPPAARRTARARRPLRLRSQRQRLAGGEGAGDAGRARPPAAVDGKRPAGRAAAALEAAPWHCVLQPPVVPQRKTRARGVALPHASTARCARWRQARTSGTCGRRSGTRAPRPRSAR